MSFTANQGQTDASVKYLSQGPGYTLFLTSQGLVLSLQQGNGTSAGQSAVITMQVVGANANPTLTGVGQLPGTSNYYVGNASQWQTKVANYSQVSYQNLYPGISALFYGNQRQVEYDFELAPGANPGVIRLGFQGQQSMSIDAQGNLVLHTTGGDVVENAPVVYQTINGVRQSVAGRFVIENDGQVGFAIGAYDASKPLTIDPLLSYSSFLGGQGGDVAVAAAVDSKGNLWLAGTTNSLDYPTKGVKQPMQSGNSEPATPTQDAFVTEINGPIKSGTSTIPAGSEVLYSAYYGGVGYTLATSIAIDNAGDVVVGGVTDCFNLVTGALGFSSPPFFGSNSFEEVNGGSSANPQDGFVLELSNLVLNFATYLGGSASDQVNGVAIDANGNIDVTGTTFSSDFPVTTGRAQTGIGGQNDAFLVQLDPSGRFENFGTFLGGSGNDFANAITLDTAGNIYVAGQTFSSNFPTLGAIQSTLSGNSSAFVTKFTSSGAIAYSTYLGGPNGDSRATSIAIDANGNVFLSGATSSADFPTAGNPFQGAFQGSPNQMTDAFVTKINSAGSNLVYSTYLGGASTRAGSVANGIVVDSSDDAIVIGTTDSSTFPTKLPIQRNLLGARDVFVTKFSADGSAVVYSTYLGGSTVEDSNGKPTNIPADNEGLAIGYNATASPESVYIVGTTDAYLPGVPFADSFPTFAPLAPNGPFIQTKLSKFSDAFVAELSDTDQVLNLNGATDTLFVPEGTVSFNVTITGVITGAGIINLNGIGEPTDTFFTLTGAYAVAPVPATMLASPGTILVNFVENGISNQLRIIVQEQPLVDTSTPVSYTAVEGSPNANQIVSTFADDNPNSTLDQYAMSRVNWGDGTPAEAVNISLLQRTNNQAFYQVIAGGHVYAHPGQYTVTTTINDKFGASVSSSLTTEIVGDAPLADTTPTLAYAAQQGLSTPSLLVGTFSDANTKAQAGDYTGATIRWGDGATSAGTIAGTSIPGNFQVFGSHTYTKVGNQQVSVFVLDSGGSTVTTGNASVFVDPAALTNMTTQPALTGVAGLDTAGLVASPPLAIASFGDANPDAAISDFNGSTISWGDGSTSALQLQIASQSGSSTVFNVINDHVYSQAGPYAITISLQNQGFTSLQIPLTETIAAATVNPVTGTEGFPVQTVIATFRDPSQPLVASNVTATIIWGDGQTSAATASSDNRGGFMIQGNHTYLVVGSFNASVTIFGSNGSSLTLNTVANIVDAPIQAQGVSFAAATNNAFTGTVATFTSAGVANPASNFSAAITWGDGQTSMGTVTATGSGTYSVTGTNTYALANTYPVTVTITDKAGGMAVASSTAKVSGSIGGGGKPPPPGFGELAAVTTGNTSTVFAITPSNMLFRHDSSGWVVLGANIIQVSASAQANGLAVVFAVTGDHGLFRFDSVNGWHQLGASGTIRSVSAGTDSGGNADAFVLTTDGTFTEYRGSSGWIAGALGGRGTILSMSAANFDRVVVVAADHAISEFDPHFGWFPLTSSGFAQSVSAVGDARGFVDVFAQTLDGSLFVYQPQAGWARIGGSGSIAAVSAGVDTTGQADAVVITTSSGLLEYRVRSGWSQFFPPTANATELSATASDRVFMTFADGSIYSEDPTLGISQIAGPGFAHL